MIEKHITKKLSAYLNHELPKDERQAVAEHLLQCEKCRNAHDEIKFGVALLAQNLKRADAPANLWRAIENNLNGKEKSRTVLIPQFSFFSPRRLAAVCVSFGIIVVFVMGVVNLFIKDSQEIAERQPTVQIRDESLPAQIANAQMALEKNSNFQIQRSNSKAQTPPKSAKTPKRMIAPPNNLPAWNVETIAGAPRAGNQAIAEKGKLAIGEFLETDANSRAKIEVANIGQVELAPNSRVQFVNTNPNEHRLSLKKGILHAQIFAPPRLFIVDTPSAVAVDLGCEYTLEVDRDGNSKLHVTSGFVALERDGRESIVPAGAMCLTRKSKGIGTPFFDDVSANFAAALMRFDFADGGSDALQIILKESRAYDTLTLWHLLAKTRDADREKVFDRLVSFVELPPGATREGVLKSDKKMLAAWRAEIEKLWFE
jgi:hypothetical protein